MARVLVVDDSKVARLVSRRALEGIGHVVEEAASVEQAWALLSQSAAFDVVLLDWNMPGGNGLSLVALMQELPRTSSLAVVFATSDSDLLHREYAAEAGACGYIVKPFTSEQLRESIDSALRQP